MYLEINNIADKKDTGNLSIASTGDKHHIFNFFLLKI